MERRKKSITSLLKWKFLSLFTSLMIALPGLLSAQPDVPPPPDQAPLDLGAGIIALILGSSVYAIKKLKGER